MSIGSTIKRLRREKDITQEQLAEYLGITSRAISQWECDRTAPDISQLPALCHVFGVSSDVLLGIDIEKSNEEIKKYLSNATELGYQGKGTERTAKQTRNSREITELWSGWPIHWYANIPARASRNTTRCLIFAIESLQSVLIAIFGMKQSIPLELLTDMQVRRTKC